MESFQQFSTIFFDPHSKLGIVLLWSCCNNTIVQWQIISNLNKKLPQTVKLSHIESGLNFMNYGNTRIFPEFWVALVASEATIKFWRSMNTSHFLLSNIQHKWCQIVKKYPYFVSVDNLVKNASQFNIQMQLLKDNRYALKKIHTYHM